MSFTFAKITHGRDDFAFGLHATPNTFSMSGGVQRADYLQGLGFGVQDCTFAGGRQALCMPVHAEFDVDAFASAFDTAFAAVSAADGHLQKCGFYLESRDFPAKHWGDKSGDGHSGAGHKRMKESEDEHFRFILTWLETGNSRGWTTHYEVKEGPIAPEMAAVFKLLGLQRFNSCIELDFEQCYWRRLRFERHGDGPFGSNTEVVHQYFDRHAAHFSAGIEQLMLAEAAMEPFGLSVLPKSAPAVPLPPVRNRPAAQPMRAGASPTATGLDDDFDVALSFAGDDRAHAEELAELLRAAGVKVFYDRFYGAQLWGKHLPEYFDGIFRKKSRFCVMFVSTAYRDRMWTTLERRSALARAIESQGVEYILPIVVEPVDIEGLPPTVGHKDLSDHTIAEIAAMLLEKLGFGQT